MQLIELSALMAGLGEMSPKLSKTAVCRVSTDSRDITGGEVFVAIKGERVDGHEYVAASLEKGAVIAVVEHEVTGVEKGRQLVVPNSLDAMIAMGANYRDRFDTDIIAVTGSVGKTTTKEFLHCVMSSFDKTLKNEGNQNNEIGLPQTLFRLDDEYRYGVLEMGMSAKGDISKLTRAAKPIAAVITNIGVAHIETLATRENILSAKLEVVEGIAEGGILAINIDNDMLCDILEIEGRPDLKILTFGIDNEHAAIKAKNSVSSDFDTDFTIINDLSSEEFTAQIPALGKHNIYNALAAYTVAVGLGLDGQTAVNALKKYESCGMRQRIITQDGVVVIEDCYNANPDSMRAAIETLCDIPGVNNRIAVLGDMLELGEMSEEAHREVGRQLAQCGIDAVVAYGSEARFIAEEAEKTIEKTAYTDDHLTAMDSLMEYFEEGSAVLFKASRGMQLEDIMELFYRRRG